MDEIRNYIYTIDAPITRTADVLVVGAGVSGLAAAISAARQGAKVIIAERQINLGGLATSGLINLFEPMCDGIGNVIYHGLCRTLLDYAIAYSYDNIPSDWRNNKADKMSPRYTTRFSPCIAALAWSELLQSEGVEILLDAAATDVITESKRVEAVVFDGREGRFAIQAKAVIDCTGDAVLYTRAGAKVCEGNNYFTYACHEISLESCKSAISGNDIRYAILKNRAGRATMTGLHQPEGQRLYAGTSTADVTEYILKNQKILLDKLKTGNRFERDIVMLPGMPQFRETRCIDGESLFDTSKPYEYIPDSIAVVTDNTQRQTVYEVPSGCIYQRCFDNLLTAGRSAAAKGKGWDVLRTIPSSIATGEAAGVISACICQSSSPVCDTITASQEILQARGVWVHIPEEIKPKY